VDWIDLTEGAAYSYEHGNKPRGYIKDRIVLYRLSNYWRQAYASEVGVSCGYVWMVCFFLEFI
jgi:hypothetical protein